MSLGEGLSKRCNKFDTKGPATDGFLYGPDKQDSPDLGSVLVGEDRIELSPRVPRTRMLALHHTPESVSSLEFRVSSQMVAELETRNSKLETLLSLHADHLLDLSDDFDQVFLVLHHRLD